MPKGKALKNHVLVDNRCNLLPEKEEEKEEKEIGRASCRERVFRAV